MKKILLIIGIFAFLFVLGGCAFFMQPKSSTSTQSQSAYPQPKARIAVADFDVKAAKATHEIGSGLREMLIAALINSNRFSLVDRQAATADLIITATVVEFEPQASGGKEGIGGGGGAESGAWGGLLGVVLNKAHIALEIRIVDTATSKVLASQRIQGQASDTAGSIMGGSPGLGTGLFLYANTPMEKAIRVSIIEAVRYISQEIPAQHYKY